MKFSLVFENSGDALPFVAINADVLEFYVEKVNQLGLNSFCLTSSPLVNAISHIKLFRSTIERVNEWLEPLTDVKFPLLDEYDYLDQDNLNYIHALWVRLQSYRIDIDQRRRLLNHSELIEQLHDLYPDSNRCPHFGDVVQKLGKTRELDSLNTPWVHGLEEKFDAIRFQCHEQWIEIQNPFPKKLVTLDFCNFYLPFNHLGRTQYNKFLTYDREYKHGDENTFNELLGFVELSLRRPETKPYSAEYLQWCESTGREPSGELLPLGNILDLEENLYQYRILLLNNVLARNNFQIHLNKG